MQPVNVRKYILLSLAVLFGICPVSSAAGQSTPPDGSAGETAFSLQPAFPNPFVSETRIPFILGEALFHDAVDGVRVTIRIYNLLHQEVARPRLRTAGGEAGPPLEAVRLTAAGSYEAVWDGRDASGARLTPGPYFVQLSVAGRSQVRKLLLAR